MLTRWVFSLVLVVALSDLGTAGDVALKETMNSPSNLPAASQMSAGKRSKRDSSPADYFQAPAEDGGNAESLSSTQTGPGTVLTDPEVTGMFGYPAALQGLYDAARAEAYQLGRDGDESGDDDDVVGDDDNEDGDDELPLYYAAYGNPDDEYEEDDSGLDKRGSRLFVGKRPRLFVGKRSQLSDDKRRLFVGKRRLFVGKRRLFVGKRLQDKRRLFVGKRRMFVGKRQEPSADKRRMFVGKRQRLFVGKRQRLFVGKRQRLFVGKRDWQANVERRLQELLQERGALRSDFSKRFREIVGDRYTFLANKRPQRMFVGKRGDTSQMMPEAGDMVGKRTRMFVGKRQQELVDNADAQDPMEFQEDAKRSRMFVGKRTMPADYDSVMDKRHRYFVGKRAEEEKSAGGDDGDASAVKDESLKRSRMFVGRR
ncbi:hypothetical protein EGW08_011942 [Elysia chlorotica]|uniref:Uncharacterized protein n=1 Tax=Elysia chlorotica TaxID=188477 RepID=A0A3S0ZQA5_ELYCH|nr:hypothetical protein EGW08_011942 [Elysia chlorotica]